MVLKNGARHSRDKNRWSTNAGALEAQTYLSKLYEAFDLTRGITLGTLTYHAHLNGRPKQSLEHQVWPSPCESAGRKFNILNRNDLDQLPSAQWLVHGILPTKGVATIFGPSMAGKSFLAIDLAATLGCLLSREASSQIVFGAICEVSYAFR